MKFTENQIKVIQSTAPITFCIAGAGGAKTTCLIERIKYLIACHVDPQHICAISFTNAAAKEIQSRLGHIKIGFSGTLHSFLLRLIRKYPLGVGYSSSNINVLDEESSDEFLEKIAEEHRYKGTKEALTAAVADGPPKEGERFTKERLVAAAYYKALRANNLMTFDAILLFGEILLQWMDRKMIPVHFKHFSVDECQDSSEQDFKIYHLLEETLDDGNTMFYVGDPDQSIYGFRKADVSQCLALAKIATVIPLEDNFRCGSRICDVAQKLISHNLDRYPKVTRSVTGFPGAVEVRAYDTPAQEAAGIANTISTTDIERKEIAVLFRTNDLVQEYANSLRAVGIPVAERMEKPRPSDWWKAKLLLSFLANPDDDYVAVRWLKVLVGEAMAMELLKDAQRNFKTINQFKIKMESPLPLLQLPQAILYWEVSSELWGDIKPTYDLLADNPEATISDLILALSEDSGEEIGDGVHVGTIHSYKGKEAGLVFLPAMEQGILPLLGKKNPREEERRICFVGMTRAKSSLVLSYSRTRVSSEDRARSRRQPSFRAKCAPTVPSQFLSESGL